VAITGAASGMAGPRALRWSPPLWDLSRAHLPCHPACHILGARGIKPQVARRVALTCKNVVGVTGLEPVTSSL
jgi:hypothetical protein